MLISSTTRQRTRHHISADDLLFMLPNASVVPLGTPGPGFEWSVWPSAMSAATPVGAATRTPVSVCFTLSASIILRSVKDLPVPGPPVRNRLRPSRTARSKARCCPASSCSGLSRAGSGAPARGGDE